MIYVGLIELLIVAFGGLVTCQTAKLTPVTNFGTNPSSITMSIYVPNTLATNPPVIIVVRTFFTLLQWYWQN